MGGDAGSAIDDDGLRLACCCPVGELIAKVYRTVGVAGEPLATADPVSVSQKPFVADLLSLHWPSFRHFANDVAAFEPGQLRSLPKRQPPGRSATSIPDFRSFACSSDFGQPTGSCY